MEVLQTDSHFIFILNGKTLWWNRQTYEFTCKNGWDLSGVTGDIECLGVTNGIIGMIQLSGVYEPHLLLIRDVIEVGMLYTPHLVYKIKSICTLGASEGLDVPLNPCSKHKPGTASANSSPAKGKKLFEGNPLVGKTLGAIKSGAKTAANLATNQVKSSVGIKDPNRVEKKVTEELHRLFDDTDSFYYSLEGDITNNLQRQNSEKHDDRFYWNKHMLKEIIELNDKAWVLPVIQGYIKIEQCVIDGENYTLAICSRRSRYRAGTRYKRRGVDQDGNVANYVETEQILSLRHHQLSFTQVRGSVPVFWSQPGYKYRPPPRLDKDENETKTAFKKHFDNELALYESICIINLTEQAGKEKVIADAFARNIVHYDSEKLIYVSFDFHSYCRGMRFENVATLIEAVAPQAISMGFHWRDAKGVICNQKAVFRVNCMDCLDRTNVVQTALGKMMLEMQLVKLGLNAPESMMPDKMKGPFMALWANNGDIISRQYAGTNALKGDYTRTGERKVTGMLKDGMNSANRYYLAHIKDKYRQATIDLICGNDVSPEMFTALGGKDNEDETDALEGAEHARILVEDCRRLLVGNTQLPIGAWGLIDADPTTGDLSETEVDTILLLTSDTYITAEYDSNLDKIVRFEEVPLENVNLIEFGTYQPAKLFPGSQSSFLCIRINYSVNGTDGFFHMFRSPNIRFFNNVAVVIKKSEEIHESLNSIVEFFRIALDSLGKKDVRVISGPLARKKNKMVSLGVPSGMPRNLSESQLVQVGSKAFSSVAGQFSKLGQKLGKSSAKPLFHIGKTEDGKRPDEASDGSDDGHVSDAEEAESIVKDSDFLPSVGIVMATGNDSSSPNETPVATMKALSSDVHTMSISSVTDVKTPIRMLQPNSPARSRSPNPEIRVEGQETNDIPQGPNTVKYSTSASDFKEKQQSASTGASKSSLTRDLTLNLTSSQSENALKQFKNLTSPFSKIAKGVQSISANLDPRKIAAKGSGILSPTSSQVQEPQEDYAEKLQQIWIESNCKTKLVAL
uniref:CSON012683 protein n=1 Tax=Culicoides sonorensis TaxID=179676 RepID=A0A336M9Y8_CULSO